MKQVPRAVVFLFLILLGVSLLAPPHLTAEEPSGKELKREMELWLNTSAGKRYKTKEEEFYRLLETAGLAGIPLSLMWERIALGAARRIEPLPLLNALEEDLVRFSSVNRIIKTSNFYFSSREEATLLLKGFYTFLIGGLEIGTLDGILSLAVLNGKDSEAVLALGTLILKVHQSFRPKEANLTQIAEAVFNSKISPSSYDSLAAFFVKARTVPLTFQNTLDIFISVLSRGGGILQLEQELSRRSR